MNRTVLIDSLLGSEDPAVLDAHLAAVQAAARATDRMANDPRVPDNKEL